MTIRMLILAFIVTLPAIARPGSGQEPAPPLPDMGEQEEAQDDAPPLPDMGGAGEEDTGPPLPEMGEPAPDAPPMPDMGDEAKPEQDAPEGAPGLRRVLEAWRAELPVPLYGFMDVRAGPRIENDPNQSRDFTLGEARLQLESDPVWGPVQFMAKADFLYDFVIETGDVRFRELNATFSPAGFVDVKLGRQILTWGTGDLVFLNDLFPKDFESFFIGRDIEYLKHPSDAVKLSLFSELANLDVVYTPQFDPDNYLTGERLSYYNPMPGAITGRPLRTDVPDDWLEDDEVAARLYRNIGGYELALYGYHGFWKSPAGVNAARGVFTFPRLNVYGASARGTVGPGIGNVEVAYYDSREDTGGSDPFVPNSQARFLVGYTQDLSRIAPDFLVGVQYYLEHMMDHADYERTLPAGMPKADENRHLLTLRLTKLLLNQDLRLELFTFWSPSDEDGHLRPHASYKITDRWRVDGGANLFWGKDDHTQFGQLVHNDNVYIGMRYTF